MQTFRKSAGASKASIRSSAALSRRLLAAVLFFSVSFGLQAVVYAISVQEVVLNDERTSELLYPILFR